MRADMFKVIIERPRWGSRFIPAAKLDRDSIPDRTRVGLRRHACEEVRWTKGLNENLKPLIRFLRRQRGRRWDDVFSEICAGLDTGSTVKMHVRQHLDDFVAIRVSRGRYGEWLHEGRVIGRENRFRRKPLFIVDPRDGILKDAAGFWNECAEALAGGGRP